MGWCLLELCSDLGIWLSKYIYMHLIMAQCPSLLQEVLLQFLVATVRCYCQSFQGYVFHLYHPETCSLWPCLVWWTDNEGYVIVPEI